jgi:hypothetical protein
MLHHPELTATDIVVDASGFSGNLSETDTDVQTALSTLDALVASGGDVSKVGTPVDNQIGVWTGDGTIEGTTDLIMAAAGNEANLYTNRDVLTLESGGATGTYISINDATGIIGINGAIQSLTSIQGQSFIKKWWYWNKCFIR